MKKQILFFLPLVLLFTSCGGTTSVTTTNPTSDPTTVVSMTTTNTETTAEPTSEITTSSPTTEITTTPEPEKIKINKDVYYDKVYGGLVAELWGNFSGLPTEFKFTTMPNPDYVPWLVAPSYATDDDTSMEFVWTHAMETYGVNEITYKDIATEWKNHIRDQIWCGNESAKKLMDQGVLPPYTGQRGKNSNYRAIDAQIETEVFGMISPGMKENARSRADWWLRSVGDLEAIECASFYSALIAELFINSDIISAINNVMELFDPDSYVVEIADVVLRAKDQFPKWEDARKVLLSKYYKNNNLDCGINFAMVLMSLIYGNNDFETTGQISLRAGFDNDCNAATACLMMGIILGYSGLPAELKAKSGDAYINTNRPGLESDTISNWAQRLVNLSEQVINSANGTFGEEIVTQDITFVPNEYWVENETIVSTANSNWKTEGFSKIYNKEFTDKTGLATDIKGSCAEIEFTGEFFTLYGLTCLEGGKVSITIDDNIQTFATFNQSSTFTLNKRIDYIPTALVSRVYNLKNEKHKVRIQSLNDGIVEIDSIGFGTLDYADNGDY